MEPDIHDHADAREGQLGVGTPDAAARGGFMETARLNAQPPRVIRGALVAWAYEW